MVCGATTINISHRKLRWHEGKEEKLEQWGRHEMEEE